MGRRRAVYLGLLAVAIALGGLGIYGMQPEITGQFHDDALYVAAAKSLAEGNGYRIESLPTTPPQTKYPPLYSHFLSWIWRLSPSFPASLFWMKAANAVFLAAIAFMAGVLYLRFTEGARWGAPLVGFLASANLVVFPFIDFTLSDIPFLLACMGGLVIARPRGPPETKRLGHAALLGAVCGLAFLLRSAAVPLIVASVVYFGLGRRWRQLAVFAVVTALFSVPWILFKLGNASDGSTNALLHYYTAYEPSVPQIALSDPGGAIEIALSNVYYAWKALNAVLFQGYVPSASFLVFPLVLWGLWIVLRPPIGFVHAFTLLYLGLIVLWPWHPARYAMPLVPLIPIALVLGTHAAVRKLGSAVERMAERRALQALVSLPLVVATVIAGGWLAAWTREGPDTTRGAFAARLDYTWDGFEETFAWVRENTEPDAVLATPYDPMFYLYTGRRGVRPWIHRPETYFYPPWDPKPVIGPPDLVRRALDELGARYLITNPLEGFLERDVAEPLFEELLEAYAGEGYAEPPRLLFVSSDSLHRVYRLPAPREPGDRAPAADGPAVGGREPS